ncbi:SUF system NifU family Fe-S cluster assembly protein [Candidatus Peregrinibacteria bacterium]|jgi:nitrogen fixation protein NifU and related proteins|nr:SUF system NifU family Fe-S cluster assembly protein [Candidatus Peregrinibacteria bacterium]
MEDQLYKEMILDLYRNPLNQKILEPYSVETKAHNPTCGDSLTLRIMYDDNKVIDIGHQGEGCAISQAAVSLITDEVKGKTKTEIKEITENQMIDMLGIPISHTRRKCALLGWQTMQDSI